MPIALETNLNETPSNRTNNMPPRIIGINFFMTEIRQTKDNYIASLQKKIGYQFSDEKLLNQALTHKSYAHEHKIDNNERLEFLGDAILQFVMSTKLIAV